MYVYKWTCVRTSDALNVQSTSSALAERIRNDILEGVFGAGDPLPQEEISSRYGVSRSPLREALRQLEAEGWIVYRPNRGATVTTIGARDVRERFMIRRILEGGAIRLAVPKVDDVRLAKVRSIDAAMRKATDHREMTALHVTFHDTIYQAIGNPTLNAAITAHLVRVQRLPDPKRRLELVQKCSRADHRMLLDALERRDVRAAERATLEHLNHIEAITIEGLE
jgi:DNA-binding GntR family transcriptional regulator